MSKSVLFVPRIPKNWVFSNTPTKDEAISHLPKMYVSPLQERSILRYIYIYNNINKTHWRRRKFRLILPLVFNLLKLFVCEKRTIIADSLMSYSSWQVPLTQTYLTVSSCPRATLYYCESVLSSPRPHNPIP
jgi:hypothetical protein